MVRGLVVAATLVGCYRPNGDQPCEIRCDPQAASNECPSGLSCVAAGLCAGPAMQCGDGGTNPDTDGPDDGMTTDVCFGTAPNTVCFDAEPTGVVDLHSFDTASCANQAGGSVRTLSGLAVNVCVIAGNSVQVTALAEVTGTLPLVVVGVAAIRVNFPLDVSSSSVVGRSRSGAGAQPGACGIPSVAGVAQGGAGGSFMGVGGRGGNGGPTGLPPVLASFHGGCVGNKGSILTPGGPGGGAVYLISDGSISINAGGAVLASGAGGIGGSGVNKGGGGGGSGGYIGLDAPGMTFGAKVIAIGGGGGAGSDANSNGGDNGGEATRLQASAAGGAPSGAGGRGGDGGTSSAGADGADQTGSGPPAGSAGGGGGGGTGLIQLFRFAGTCGTCTPAVVP